MCCNHVWMKMHIISKEIMDIIIKQNSKTSFSFCGEKNTKGHCTLSPKFSHALFCFFVFLILSYQNACNECENAENLTDESFGGSVQTWLTQREVVFIFNVRKFLTLSYPFSTKAVPVLVQSQSLVSNRFFVFRHPKHQLRTRKSGS